MSHNFNNFIAVFGGSFNPVSNAHICIAQKVMDELKVKKVVFLPVGDNYPKKDLIKSSVRLDLLRRAIHSNPCFEISEIEINSSATLKTVDSLNILRSEYPNSEIAFIMGSDNIDKLICCSKFRTMLENYYVIIAPRGKKDYRKMVKNSLELNKYLDKFLFLGTNPISNISSSYIRTLIKNQASIQDCVPLNVYSFLKELGWVV